CINFIIFIWLGKVLLNMTAFFKNPLVILAYPSSSEAFYLAVLFSFMLLLYKTKREKMNAVLFIEAFIPVFLTASFLYEFIQLNWNDNIYSLGNLALFTILLVIYYLIRDQLPHLVMILMLIVWSSGSVILSFI